jgi:hypothetical protein
MIKPKRLPRKIKKGLKTACLRQVGDWWSSKDVRVLNISKNIKPNKFYNQFKGYTVIHSTLG